MVDKVSKPFSIEGVSGLPRYSGYIFDEWMPELQGPKGRRVLREMMDNSAVIGAVLFSIEMMIRQVGWEIVPGGKEQADEDAATFVEECLHDCETSWEDMLADILSMLGYGWSLFETVYKQRDGVASKFDDGKIGWQGWQMRGQETLHHWDYEDDKSNFPKAFVQLGPPDWQTHEIPMEKCLLFRTTTRRGNPEGRSILRNAYRSWYFTKHLEAVEGIGAERDLAGLPVMRVPTEILAVDAADDQRALRDSCKQLVTNIRRDEQEGVIIPSDCYPETQIPMYTLELLSTGGQRQFNLDDVIERWEQRILMSVLADFIMLGHTNVGTQSLGQTKAALFTTALGAWLASICAQINDVAIPRLLSLNGIEVENPPTIEHGNVERQDLDVLGQYLMSLGNAGFTLDTDPQGALTRHLLEQAHLPDPPEDLTVPFNDQGLLDQWGQPLIMPGQLYKAQKPAALVPSAGPQMPGAPGNGDAGQAGQPGMVKKSQIPANKKKSLGQSRAAGPAQRRANEYQRMMAAMVAANTPNQPENDPETEGS